MGHRRANGENTNPGLSELLFIGFKDPPGEGRVGHKTPGLNASSRVEKAQRSLVCETLPKIGREGLREGPFERDSITR